MNDEFRRHVKNHHVRSREIEVQNGKLLISFFSMRHRYRFKVIYLDLYLNKESFIYFEYRHQSKIRNELLNKKSS